MSATGRYVVGMLQVRMSWRAIVDDGGGIIQFPSERPSDESSLHVPFRLRSNSVLCNVPDLWAQASFIAMSSSEGSVLI